MAEATRRDDLLVMLLHGGAATNSIARFVVDKFAAEVRAEVAAEQAAATDDTAMQALSDAGAQCGDCGHQAGDRICPDCERCYGWYVAALRKAGWAPRAEVLAEAADLIEAEQHRLDDEENTKHGYLDHESELQHVAVHAMGALLRHLAASSSRTAADEQPAAVEFGVRAPSGDVLAPTFDRAEAERRLARYGASFATVRQSVALVQRTVRYGPWIEVPR